PSTATRRRSARRTRGRRLLGPRKRDAGTRTRRRHGRARGARWVPERQVLRAPLLHVIAPLLHVILLQEVAECNDVTERLPDEQVLLARTHSVTRSEPGQVVLLQAVTGGKIASGRDRPPHGHRARLLRRLENLLAAPREPLRRPDTFHELPQ